MRFNMVCKNILGLVALVSVLLISCTDPELKKQFNEHANRIDSLESKIKNMEIEIEIISRDRTFDELIKSFDEIAYLTPGADGYSIIKTRLGAITIILKDVRAYANGSRITLQIGNTTSATMTGAKATIQWGSVDNEGFVIQETEREREVTINQDLRSGRWTDVNVVLEGFQPVELGYVRIKDFEHKGIRLLVN